MTDSCCLHLPKKPAVFMSSHRNSQQGPADLPSEHAFLQCAIKDSFSRGVGAPMGGGSAPQGRPHQIDAVTRVVTAVKQDCKRAEATNFLLQHSAGSGKSLTIAALVAALLRTEDDAGRRFHTVLVVNDRLQLDQQLGDTVSNFLAGNGFPVGTLARANSSNQLRSFLLASPNSPGRPSVILTTIQKLGSLWRNTDSAAWRRARKQSGQSRHPTAAEEEEEAAGGGEEGAVQAKPTSDIADNMAGKAPGASLGATGDGAFIEPQNQSLADVQSDARSQLLGVLAQGRVAVIADEAHRHHGNSTSEQIAAILAAAFGTSGSTDAGPGNSNSSNHKNRNRKQGQSPAPAAGEQQDGAAGLWQQRQPRFVTYFGFTATPGPRALQLFGVSHQVQVDILGSVVAIEGADNPEAADQQSSKTVQQQQQQTGVDDNDQPDDVDKHQKQQYLAPATLYTPFHCYSLQQAVSDGFVLDVLQRFVSVTPRIQIAGLQLTEQQQQQLLKLDQASRLGLPSSSNTGKDLRSQLLGPRAAAAAAATRPPAGNSNNNPSLGLPPLQNPSGPSLAEELLVQAASNSRQLVSVKAEAVVDRFMTAWSEAAACGFVGFRAMVVVRSRQHVVWYVQELRRLLQQHQQQAGQLLKLAGETVDLDAAEAVAVGDTSPLCYGAYSGSVAVTAAEAQQLRTSSGSRDSYHRKHGATTPFIQVPAATAAAAQALAPAATTRAGMPAVTGKRKRPDTNAAAAATAGSNGALRQRKSSGSSWDSALAAFDAEQAAKQQQQQQQNGDKQLLDGDRRGERTPPATAGAGDISDQQDSSWFLKSGRPSTDEEAANGSSSSSSSEEGDNDTVPQAQGSSGGSGSACNTTSSSDSGHDSDSDSDIGSNEDQEQIPAPAPTIQNRKRIKRNSSTLSCSTASAATAAADADADAGVADADSEDEQPLMARVSQQQQQQQHTPAAAAAAAVVFADDGAVVSVSERDLNPDGFTPADARLLVVCSKFETGYDDPRLGAMFIDRSLAGARAVQVLGRVNRPAPGKGLPLSSGEPHTGQQDPAAAASAAEDGNKPARTTGHLTAATGARGHASTGAEDLKPDQPAPNTAAAAAGATGGSAAGSSGFHAVVVDFVNSVGTIKEAFSEFYGTTTYCTGSQAKRRRQQQAMDDTITRVLEVLQPAAARQHTRQQLRQQQQHGSIAAANSSSSSSSLAVMNVSQIVQLVGVLPPETQKAVEDDVSQYCSLCTKLRLEKLEFPYVFASALLHQLTARRQRRDKAASSGRFAWMENLHATAAAGAAAAAAGEEVREEEDANDAQVLEHTEQQQQGAVDGNDGSTGPATGTRLHRKLNVSVRVCELETTFAGAVKLSASEQPLRSVKLTSHLSAAAKATGAAAAAAMSPDKQVRSGRPLHEVIAAANAQLAGRFKKQVVEGLRELCDKLKGAEGRLLAMERLRQAQQAAAAVPAARVEVVRGSQQQPQPAAVGTRAAAAAEASAVREGEAAEDGQQQQQQQQQQQDASAAEGEDVYRILSLLRRLQLWPVTADLLKSTAAGKQVSALRNHPNSLVSNLATQVVQQWKTQLNAQQAAAAAAAAKKAKEKQDAKSSGSSTAEKAAQTAQSPAAAIGPDLRKKVANMMKDALVDHKYKVLRQQQQQQQQQGSGGGSAGGDDSSMSPSLATGELSQLQQLADVLEAELYQYVTKQGNTNSNGSAVAGNNSSSMGKAGAAVQEYKSRARMLCTGIRYPDGVAPALISREKLASEVVGLDALSLAPAAVQEAIKKRQEEQRRAEEVWESLVQGSVGGGGTFVTTEVSCPQCGKSRAQVHNIMSGGTYAQERVPIQKYVCQECLHTWRND